MKYVQIINLLVCMRVCVQVEKVITVNDDEKLKILQ